MSVIDTQAGGAEVTPLALERALWALRAYDTTALATMTSAREYPRLRRIVS